MKCKTCNKSFTNAFERASHERFDHRAWSELSKDATRRKRLVKEQGHHCSVCKLSEWQDKPIPIELDHIDGNPENNSKDNCRLICPNCHAQTTTYKGRNIGNIDGSKRKRVMARYDSYRKKEAEREAQREDKEIVIAELVQKVVDSGIDVSKHGWCTQVSKIINISPQKTRAWVLRNMPEFYKERCK